MAKDTISFAPTEIMYGSEVRMWRESGGLTISVSGDTTHFDHATLARIEAGWLPKEGQDNLSCILIALQMSAEGFLRCLGVDLRLPTPEVYFRLAFGLSESHAATLARYAERLADQQEEAS